MLLQEKPMVGSDNRYLQQAAVIQVSGLAGQEREG
jgi:hypothetical protein